MSDDQRRPGSDTTRFERVHRRGRVRRTGVAVIVLMGMVALPPVRAETAPPGSFEVRVTSRSGQPLENVRVDCLDSHEPEGWAVGRSGVLVAPRACARIRCSAEGYIALEREVESPSVRCELDAASLVSVRFVEERCEGECSLSLRRVGARDSAPTAEIRGEFQDGEHRLPPVLPGSYELEVLHVADDWSCHSRVSVPTAGAWPIAIVWREPSGLAGRVTRDGLPVEDVIVRASRHMPEPAVTTYGSWSCGPSEVEAATAGDGHFELDTIDPSASWLVVAGDVESPRGIAATLVEAPRQVELALQLPMLVTGTVIDEEERPVGCQARAEFPEPLADLLAHDWEEARTGECDDEGGFTLGPFLPTTTQILVRPTSGAPLFLSAEPPEGGTTVDLGNIRVTRGSPVRVKVVSEAGGPIAEATVALEPEGFARIPVEGTTDEDGWAEIHVTNPHASLRLTASADGHVEGNKSTLMVEDAPFEIALRLAGTIRGRVVGPGGDPVADATIQLRPPGRRIGGSATTRSDADGLWEFASAVPGRCTLTASARGYRDSSGEDLDVKGGRTLDVPDLQLGVEDRVEGEVLSPSGVPVSGARVLAGPAHQPVGTTVSDDRGRFTLVRSSRWNSLTVRKEGYGQAHVSPVPIETDEPIRVRLYEECRLIVNVPDDLPGGVLVEITDGGGAHKRESVAGRTKLAFGGLAPGPGQAALRWWHRPGMHDGVHYESKLEFDLAPGATEEIAFGTRADVLGQVTLEGQPASLAVVAAYSTGDSETGGFLDGLADARMTDHDGRYRLTRLPAGPARLEAHASGAKTVREIVIPESGSVVVDLEITPVVVDLLVTDSEDGAPLRAVATLVSEDQVDFACSSHSDSRAPLGSLFGVVAMGASSGGVCAQERTGPAGRVRLAVGAPGPYALRVKGRSYEIYKTTVSLGPGTTALGVELTRAPDDALKEKAKKKSLGNVVVNVDAPPGTAHAFLSCSGVDGSFWGGAAPGRNVCGPFRPGPGEVVFHIPGYGIARAAFDVPEGDSLEITLSVVRGGNVVVPSTDASSQPAVLDGAEVDWAAVTHTHRRYGFVAEVGTAWSFADLPPGDYNVLVDGQLRSQVRVLPGETVVAW